MRNEGQKQESGGALPEIVRQAITALATMDATRLEELAQGCADLRRARSNMSPSGSVTERDMDDCVELDLRVFGQLLVETRSNLELLARMHTLRVASASQVNAVSNVADIGRNRGRKGVSWEQSIQP